MEDHGFFLTLQAIRRQMAAMPNELYLVRLIHSRTRQAFPGERLWTAEQLASSATVRFLRGRNREGCDVYVQPYAGNQNAGYILVDLDHTRPTTIATMHAHGHDPCVVVQTSPAHLQAWIRLSASPLEPALASAAGKLLAAAYGGDPASTDWRHLGRLAGFTNQKPARRTAGGYAPWVKVVSTQAGVAPQAEALLQSARASASPTPALPSRSTATFDSVPATIAASVAAELYQACMQRWHIRQRFPQPDWSVVDCWVARHLLRQQWTPAQVREILRLASPQFPRRHGDPDDYLHRTVARAAFPSSPRSVCADHARASIRLGTACICSNSTGGRYPNAECSRFWL
jgi:hypothetical protein